MQRLFIILIVLGCSCSLFAQNLNGKWMGYFTPNADLDGKTYTYELTIQEAANHALSAITITKFSNHAEAKAIANGLYTPKTQLVSIQENKFEQIQLERNMQACLMSNFLSYQNIRGHEILQGTYMSNNIANGKDCGGGSVFLEKIEALTKNAIAVKKTSSASAPIKLINNKKELKGPIVTTIAIENTKQNSTTPTYIANKTTNNLVVVPESNNYKQSEMVLPEDAAIETHEEAVVKKNNELQVIPWVLVARENKLVKKLITHNKTISIDLYDNGTIDNDTIIVYDNKQLIINKKRLSYKAIHFDLNFSNNTKEHEVIIVAHNMGTVPPNTALLVYKDGVSRQELFITSTNKMNAKLVIEYEPPNER